MPSEPARRPDERGNAPVFDAWRSEVGDAAIATIVAKTKRQIELGAYHCLNDTPEFLEYQERARTKPT